MRQDQSVLAALKAHAGKRGIDDRFQDSVGQLRVANGVRSRLLAVLYDRQHDAVLHGKFLDEQAPAALRDAVEQVRLGRYVVGGKDATLGGENGKFAPYEHAALYAALAYAASPHVCSSDDVLAALTVYEDSIQARLASATGAHKVVVHSLYVLALARWARMSGDMLLQLALLHNASSFGAPLTNWFDAAERQLLAAATDDLTTVVAAFNTDAATVPVSSSTSSSLADEWRALSASLTDNQRKPMETLFNMVYPSYPLLCETFNLLKQNCFRT